MKKTLLILFSALLLACNGNTENPDNNTPSVPAFPGAEGCGMYATGGRGAMTYHVTTLEDDYSHPGSLRYVLTTPGPKTVVFDVAGTIHLKTQLVVSEGGITIAGQTAPGDGICIAGAPVIIKASNVIIRFLRFRMGDENKIEGDALSCDGGHRNIIIDHCSFSWSTDECVSCYGISDFTLQYCFITESLRQSVHLKGGHGYGGIWGGNNVTFHHNLLAHHDSRNPRFDHDYVDSKYHGPLDFVNNVVYNWGSNSAYGGESVSENRKINFVGNYYKPGPATKSGVKTRLLNVTTYCTNCVKNSGKVVPGSFYLADNYMYGSDDVSNDNWLGVILDSKGSAKLADCKSSMRHTISHEVKAHTATQAYDIVLEKAGCSYVRDKIDERIVGEVKSGIYTYKGSNGSTNGLIDSQQDVGGWPNYKGEPLLDTDRDGIPDEWEEAHGLNPNLYGDATMKTLDANYTNIEVYFNSLVAHLY